MKFFEIIVNQKINHIKPNELLQLAKQYNVTLTPQEANHISQLLVGKGINIFDPQQREKLIQQIAKITGLSKAKQMEQIFHQMIGSS